MFLGLFVLCVYTAKLAENGLEFGPDFVFFVNRRGRKKDDRRGRRETTAAQGRGGRDRDDDQLQRKRQQRRLYRRRGGQRTGPPSSAGVAERFVPSAAVARDVAQPALAAEGAVAVRRFRRRRPAARGAAPPPGRVAATVLVGRRVRPVAGVHRHGVDGRPEADHHQGAHVARRTAQFGQPSTVSPRPQE